MNIPVVSISDNVVLPNKAHKNDAGYDLRSTSDVVLHPFERALIPTGISLAIPSGYAGLVLPRSGLALNCGLSIVNAPGLIDSNYRGEIKVIAINLDPQNAISIAHGDRIAQLIIQKVEDVTFHLVDSLPLSERGIGGFGSSGIKG